MICFNKTTVSVQQKQQEIILFYFGKLFLFLLKNILKTHNSLSKCKGKSLVRTQKMRKGMIKVIEPINLASLKLPKLEESLTIKGII